MLSLSFNKSNVAKWILVTILVLFFTIQVNPVQAEVTARFWAFPRYDVIQTEGWESEINLEISVYSDEDKASLIFNDDFPTDSFGGGSYPDIPLEVGNFVEITDGTTTKSLVLQNVEVIEVNAGTQTINGVAPYPSQVYVGTKNEFDEWLEISVPTIEGGTWEASFEGLVNITSISIGSVDLYDADGDASSDKNPGGIPKVSVHPDSNWISAYGWDIDASLTITVEDDTKTAVLWENDTPLIAERASWDFFIGELLFDLDPSEHHLEPGQYVTITDGTTTKVLEIQTVTVDYVDTVLNSVGGTGPIGSIGGVWIDTGQGQHWLPVSITDNGEGQGVWEANFGDDGFPFDSPIYEANIAVQDIDGDGTLAYWNPPQLAVEHKWDRISFAEFPIGHIVEFSIYDTPGGALLFGPLGIEITDSWTTYWNLEWLDVTPGMHIVGVDTTTFEQKEVIVDDLEITLVDYASGIVRGIASPGSVVAIWANNPDYGERIQETADINGEWEANFDSLSFPLSYDTQFFTEVSDNDNDKTIQSIRGIFPNEPTIIADINTNSLGLLEFEPHSMVKLEVYDQYQGNLLTAVTYGIFGSGSRENITNINNVDLLPGMYIKATDQDTGFYKELTLEDITFDVFNPDTKEVSGTGPNELPIVVSIGDDWNGFRFFDTTVDSSGNWYLDLSSVEFEFLPGMEGIVQHIDLDSDRTNYTYAPQMPIECDTTGNLDGTIYAADGITPIPFAPVTIAQYNNSYYLRTRADENGYYGCTLLPGEYVAYASPGSSEFPWSFEWYDNAVIPEDLTIISVNETSPLYTADFVLDSVSTQFHQWFFNFDETSPTSELSIRQAIAYGTNRQSIIDILSPTAKIASTYLPETHWAYPDSNLPYYDFNTDRANQILDAAGIVDTNMNGIREFEGEDIYLRFVLFDEYPPELASQAANSFQADMSLLDLGVDIQLVQDSIELFDILYDTKDFDIVPYMAWWIARGSERFGEYISTSNFGDYPNPEAPTLYEYARSAETKEEGKTFYLQHQILLMEELAFLPIFHSCDSFDIDCDYIFDVNDNSPNGYNPDQSDLDGDGVGDVTDLCPADPSDTCIPEGSTSESIGVRGGTLTTPDSQTNIEIPEEALTSQTSISVTNLGSGYVLGDTEAVYGVNIGPDGTEFEVPITITMAWTDNILEGYVDGTGQDELLLFISKDGVPITDICANEPGCDPIANTFSVQVSSLSDFLLVTYTTPNILELNGPQDPVRAENPVEMLAHFSGFYSPTVYSAIWDWGDETTSQGVVTVGEISGNHIYNEAGVYTVTLTIENPVGGFDIETFQYIVVYDPSAGFVTGGGWFYSPESAYQPDPSLIGKATFGFVSKYKKGTKTPSGNTEFEFNVADLLFESTNYDWLVVTGSDYARFKGTGTINGSGEYKFQIWASDDDPDTFRIKIWEEDELGVETVIYDNGFDQPIGGGSIVIHTK